MRLTFATRNMQIFQTVLLVHVWKGAHEGDLKDCIGNQETFSLVVGKIYCPEHIWSIVRNSALGRMEAGQTLTEVCKAKSVRSGIWKWFKDTGNVRRQSGHDKKHATTDFQDCNLATIAKRNRQLKSVYITRNSTAAIETWLFRFTVSGRLHTRKSLTEFIMYITWKKNWILLKQNPGYATMITTHSYLQLHYRHIDSYEFW